MPTIIDAEPIKPPAEARAYFYRCPAKWVARKATLSSEIAALKADIAGGKVSDGDMFSRMADLSARRDGKVAGDDHPDVAGVRVRWLRDPDEFGMGIIESPEPLELEEAEAHQTDSIKPWYCDGKIEFPANSKDKPVFGSHSWSQADTLPFEVIRKFAIAEYDVKQNGGEDFQIEALARLREKMKTVPLGKLLREDPAALPDYVELTSGEKVSDYARPRLWSPDIKKTVQRVLDASIRVAADPKFSTLAKIPGWTPTNAYAGTIRDSAQNNAYSNNWQSNTVKWARVWTAGASYTLASISIDIAMTGTVTGELTMKVYAGTPSSPGSLLATWVVNALEFWSSRTYIVFGGSTAAISSGSTYFFELSTTATLDASNYLTLYSDSSASAGDQNWSWDGATWTADATYRMHLNTMDNADGGKFHWRTDANASTASTIKGAAVHSSDTGTVTMGATLTYDGNYANLQTRVGDAVRGAANAYSSQVTGYRYGHLTYAAGVTHTFTGNATATNSGLLSSPTSADTSSKASTLSILGTSASPTIFTNSAGAYSASYRYVLNWYYGQFGTMGHYKINYASPANGAAMLLVPATSSLSAASAHELGHITATLGDHTNTSVAVISNPYAGARTIPIAADDVIADNTSESWSNYTVCGYHGSYGGSAAAVDNAPVTIRRWKFIGASGSNSYVAAILLHTTGGSYDVYARPLVHSVNTDNRATQTTPTGLSIADLGNGKGGLATITNIASYANTDEIVVTASDGTTVIGRGTKTEYTANSGIICPNVTMGSARTGDKALATSDLYVESGFSDAAAEWTPTAPSTAPAPAPDVSAARVSDTAIRLTVTNATGVTVRSYYATTTDGGDTWTAGGTCSGDGTIDITVVAGTEYYLWVLADNGVYSLPSNIVRMTSSTGSGTTLTVGLGFPNIQGQPEVLTDGLGEQRIRAIYDLGPLSLSGANLENGDFLPADTNYGIAASTWEVVDAKRRRVRNSMAWEAVVEARAVRAWEDSFA